MARIPPLAAVRVFEAAARHENFSRAAEELAMTQAGVSYQIKLLEDRLGAQLFARKGRGMVLTALGRRIAPRVSEAFAGLEDAFSQVREENETILTLTAPHSFATLWLSGRLGAFQLRHPGLAVRLDVSDKMVDLESGEYDLAIRGTEDPGPGLEKHMIIRQVFTPMATPELIERHGLRLPEDLARVPRISPDDLWWQRWFEKLADPRTVVPQAIGIRFDSQVLDGQAALAGHGVAMLNPAMFARELAEGRLVAPFPCLASERRAIWLCYTPLKRRLTKVRAFRDWLLAEMRKAVGEDPCGLLADVDCWN